MWYSRLSELQEVIPKVTAWKKLHHQHYLCTTKRQLVIEHGVRLLHKPTIHSCVAHLFKKGPHIHTHGNTVPHYLTTMYTVVYIINETIWLLYAYPSLLHYKDIYTL